MKSLREGRGHQTKKEETIVCRDEIDTIFGIGETGNPRPRFSEKGEKLSPSLSINGGNFHLFKATRGKSSYFQAATMSQKRKRGPVSQYQSNSLAILQGKLSSKNTRKNH